MRDEANDRFVAQRFRIALTEFLKALKEGGPTIEQRSALACAVNGAEILDNSIFANVIEDCFVQQGYPLARHDRLGTAQRLRMPQSQDGLAFRTLPKHDFMRSRRGWFPGVKMQRRDLNQDRSLFAFRHSADVVNRRRNLGFLRSPRTMREWLYALAPLAVVVYFALNPDRLALMMSEATSFLH